MKTTLLVLVCGSTMSLAAAMQPANQPDRRPGEQPGQTNPSQPRDTQPRDNQPGRVTPIDRTTLRTQPDSVLRKLEGTWKVDVTVSPEFWAEHHGGPQVRTPGDRTTTPLDPSRPQNPADRDGTNRPGNDQRPNVPGQPDRTNQPNQPGQPGTISSSTGFTGFAQTRLIMGGQILEETIRIPNMAMGGAGGMNHRDTTRTPDRDTTTRPSGISPDRTNQPSGTTPDRTNQPSFAPGQPDRDTDRPADRDATPRDRDLDSPTRIGGPGMGAGGMVGRMFLAFDEGSRNYTVVFMENRSGKIHTHTGTFDATGNRIVFRGDGHKDGTKDGISNTGAGNRAKADDKDTRIVLEFSGDDRYTVTMYRGSGTTTTDSTPGNEPNSKPGDRTGGANRDDAMGAMFYRASYTKLSGSDMERARDVLRMDEPGRIGADRINPAGTSPNNR
ncbi:MAG: hypothetical protein L6Q35_12225 [Phycisphaerales bacterium]|nr:hypothetical protein [Phycisphaerales bacterium]